VNAHDAPADGSCEVIPVIDLMGGQVVHARLGDRAHYQPIRSRICNSAAIEPVVHALLALFGFRCLYVADLDALQGRPRQLAAIDAVRRAAPGQRLWIDAAVRDRADLHQVAERGTPVLASETLSPSAAESLLAACPQAVLSIDYHGIRFIGDPTWLQRCSQWPADVIAMNLAHVGSNLGPDLKLIEALRRRAPRSRVYVGGGVRNATDLRRCREAGAAGALLASALHDGRMGRADLEDVCGSSPRPPDSSKVNGL
jgi:phosphoribosylformimino-5-aminoimidazole carboxamide ribotide isomerase